MIKKKLLEILSILLMIVPFLINVYSVLRLISFIAGLIIFEIILRKNIKVLIVDIFMFIAIIFGFIFIDYSLSKFDRISVFSYEVKSSSKVKTYYSLFYKTTLCDNNWYLDKFYKQSYQCNKEDLDIISVNDFISNYEKNKKAYFRISGKISKIVGQDYFELKPYELLDDSKNGNVSFQDGVTLNIPITNLDFTGYNVYDEITVIGRVESRDKNKEETIYNFTDINIYKSNLYDKYSLDFEVNNKCSTDKSLYANTESYNYYTSCINNIIIIYDENNIYDLDYLLLDGKITLDDFIHQSDLNASDEEGNELYSVGELRVLHCKNNDVVFGKDVSLDDGYCNISIEDEEDGV